MLLNVHVGNSALHNVAFCAAQSIVSCWNDILRRNKIARYHIISLFHHVFVAPRHVPRTNAPPLKCYHFCQLQAAKKYQDDHWTSYGKLEMSFLPSVLPHL